MRATHTRVNTTAKTLVGRADDDELLGLLGLDRLGLGRLVDLVRGLTEGSGLVHGTLRASELGGGDDLHGVGDLLDVLDGLEAVLDLAKGGVGRNGVRADGSSSVQITKPSVRDL